MESEKVQTQPVYCGSECEEVQALLIGTPEFDYHAEVYYSPALMGTGLGSAGSYRPRRRTHLDPELAQSLGLVGLSELVSYTRNHLGFTLMVKFQEYPAKTFKVEHYDVWKFKNCGQVIEDKLLQDSEEHSWFRCGMSKESILKVKVGNKRVDMSKEKEFFFNFGPMLDSASLVARHERCLGMSQVEPISIYDDFDMEISKAEHEVMVLLKMRSNQLWSIKNTIVLE